MKKMKQMSAILLTVVMSLGLSTTAFAAEPTTSNSGRTELAAYNQVLNENRDVLQGLISENKTLMEKVKTTQKEMKESGTLTKEIAIELKNMSALIQNQRISLTEKRDLVMELHDNGRKSMEAGDIETAKITLEQVIEIQLEQLELQNGLSNLLVQKLEMLQNN